MVNIEFQATLKTSQRTLHNLIKKVQVLMHQTLLSSIKLIILNLPLKIEGLKNIFNALSNDILIYEIGYTIQKIYNGFVKFEKKNTLKRKTI